MKSSHALYEYFIYLRRLSPLESPRKITLSSWGDSLLLFHYGIYRFEDNGDLTLCVHPYNEAGSVPEKFQITGDKPQVLIRLRRMPEHRSEDESKD